jgi:FkbM family methyltransferase
MKKVGDYWLPDADSYFEPIFKRGEGFQLDRLDTALSFVPPERFGVAVDGGAHVGSWTRVLAGCFERVIAFEPAIDTYECLVKNTEAYPNVFTYNEALGDADKLVTVMDDVTRAGNTGSRFVQPCASVSSVRTSAMTSLDALKLDRLDFLKLDVEGAELLALQGARLTLLEYRPVVLVESKKGMAERFGNVTGDCLRYLTALGATQVATIKSDYIYTFT